MRQEDFIGKSLLPKLCFEQKFVKCIENSSQKCMVGGCKRKIYVFRKFIPDNFQLILQHKHLCSYYLLTPLSIYVHIRSNLDKFKHSTIINLIQKTQNKRYIFKFSVIQNLYNIL